MYGPTRHLLLGMIVLMAGCVPSRKYEEANARLKAAMDSEAQAVLRAERTEAALKEHKAQLDDLMSRKDKLERDTLTLGTSLRRMTNQYDKINALNNELLDKYNLLVSGHGSENRRLLSDLEATRLKLQVKEDSLERLAGSLAEREAALEELRSELARKDAAMKSLKDKVSNALTGFEGKGLTVTQRDGKIYVSMENKLLFPSGSTAVDKQGQQALENLAKAIENEKDLNILVEGHTDTDQVRGGSAFKDNWDLSVLRATSVVRILQSSSKIDPLRITAGGRGEFLPLDAADKAKNRRIEVILAPDLNALYNLVTD